VELDAALDTQLKQACLDRFGRTHGMQQGLIREALKIFLNPKPSRGETQEEQVKAPQEETKANNQSHHNDPRLLDDDLKVRFDDNIEDNYKNLHVSPFIFDLIHEYAKKRGITMREYIAESLLDDIDEYFRGKIFLEKIGKDFENGSYEEDIYNLLGIRYDGEMEEGDNKDEYTDLMYRAYGDLDQAFMHAFDKDEFRKFVIENSIENNISEHDANKLSEEIIKDIINCVNTEIEHLIENRTEGPLSLIPEVLMGKELSKVVTKNDMNYYYSLYLKGIIDKEGKRIKPDTVQLVSEQEALPLTESREDAPKAAPEKIKLSKNPDAIKRIIELYKGNEKASKISEEVGYSEANINYYIKLFRNGKMDEAGAKIK